VLLLALVFLQQARQSPFGRRPRHPLVVMVVTGSPKRRCSRCGKFRSQPPGHRLGQRGQDDLIDVPALQHLTDRLERIWIP
jgi:hypothetical protein